jgi:hypothetical protein
MGMVMVKCPQTGRAIPTGIQTDRESFRRSPVFFAHPLPDLPHRSRLVRTGSVGRRDERPGAASQRGAPWPDRQHSSSMIAMEGHHCAHANLH